MSAKDPDSIKYGRADEAYFGAIDEAIDAIDAVLDDSFADWVGTVARQAMSDAGVVDPDGQIEEAVKKAVRDLLRARLD